MKRKFALLSGLTAFLILFSTSAFATQIFIEPQGQIFNVGDTLNYDFYADIDADDAIMGFGFDFSFDGGNTFITGPGESGSSLTFDSFTPNAALGFSYDPFFDSDGDTISGFLGPLDPDVSGTGINLGTFEFTAFALAQETIYLGADDIGSPFSTEGLVPGFTAISFDSFLPNTATASAAPVPEPTTMLLLGTGLVGITGFRKKQRKLNH